MHLLSSRNRSEFLAVPELVRFTLADGMNGPETTLLIKSSTLTLKYLLRLKRFRVFISRIGSDELAYGVQIDDDQHHPAMLWSLLEYDDELAAINALLVQPKCVVFLFNELAANVAWGEVDIDFTDETIGALVRASALHPPKTKYDAESVGRRLEALFRNEHRPSESGHVSEALSVPEWHPLKNHLITNRASSSLISIFEADEGAQQEEIGLWLTDNLKSTGAVKSPQIHETSGSRELSDVLMSHEFGAFLIESKTLSIFARDQLPDRSKLSRNITRHIHKAAGQLVGGVKNLRRGYRITDTEGNEIEVERKNPTHAIILVPDLTLLSEATEFSGEFIRQISLECGGFLHILDPAELLRVVQAAEMISEKSVSVTPIMAFDYYLMERAKRAVKSDTPNFGMLIRFENEIPPIESSTT